MAEQCYLAVDLGAESGRVIAGLLNEGRLTLEEVHRFPNGPVNMAGTLRWNVLGLWVEIQNGLAKAAAQYGDSILSVGVDTWGVDYTLLSATNELLGQPYCYRDPRTLGMIETMCSRVPREEIFAATGIQFIEINTLVQLVAMQQSNRDLLEMADKLLMMPDFFNWLLCGSRVAEFTDATTTQCYNPRERNWAFDLLRKLELPTHLFPEIVQPGTKLGQLREQVAKQTGLKRVDVVAPATHDTGSAVAAVPTERTGQTNWAYISSGTWCLMGVEVPDAILSERALQLNVTNEGGVDGTFRLLRNIMGLWLVQQCRRSFERKGKSYDYSQLTELAAKAPPFRSLVNPDDVAFLSPEDMPTALQEWCRKTDQPVPETEGQLVRCCLESLALRYRMVLEWLEELTGNRIEVIHIVGGGSKNELLDQFAANACGRPVVTGPVEATAMGNVLVQARAQGAVGSLAELREVVRRSTEMRQFEPQDTDVWEQAYRRFKDLVERPT